MPEATQPGSLAEPSDYTREITEQAAATLITAHDLLREDGESCVQAVGWAMGEILPYEQLIPEIVTAAIAAHERVRAGLDPVEPPPALPPYPQAAAPDWTVRPEDEAAYWDSVLAMRE